MDYFARVFFFSFVRIREYMLCGRCVIDTIADHTQCAESKWAGRAQRISAKKESSRA